MPQKNVAGYIRVSTEEQSQKGLSLESQRTDIEDYCRRCGYMLVKLYVDRGITARKDLYKRAAFMEMMHDVQNKIVDHIVVLRLDRFFRNVYDYHRMMHEFLDPAGCGWSAVKEEYDTTTTNGRLMINLRLAIAEQECDQDSDRIKDVFANRIREGFVVTGVPPLGYKIVDKRLVPSDDAPMVRDFFETFMRKYSVRLVMLEMRQKYGMYLTYDRILTTLRKEIYTGRYRDNPHYCPPIVPDELFAAVQDALNRNIKAKGPESKVYIFSGLLKCARCGHTLSGSSPKARKFTYYRCGAAYQNLTCDNRHNTSEQKVERYLLDNIDTLIEQYELNVAEAKKENAAGAPRKANRKQIMQKIDRLTELYVNGLIDIEEFKRRRSEYESQIIDDEPERKDISAALRFAGSSNFRPVYEGLSRIEKRAFWTTIIKEMHCESNEVRSVIFR